MHDHRQKTNRHNLHSNRCAYLSSELHLTLIPYLPTRQYLGFSKNTAKLRGAICIYIIIYILFSLSTVLMPSKGDTITPPLPPCPGLGAAAAQPTDSMN